MLTTYHMNPSEFDIDVKNSFEFDEKTGASFRTNDGISYQIFWIDNELIIDNS